MSTTGSLLLVLSSLLAIECATAQVDARNYFEHQVLRSAVGLKASDFTVLGPTIVKAAGTVDSTVELRFGPSAGQPLAMTPEFFAALVHNIELDPPSGNGVWRLRRARFEHAPGDFSGWFASALVFGCRRDGDDGNGANVPLPRARPAIWHFCREVATEGQDGVRWCSVDVDMTGERLQLTAAVEVRGEGFRKRFLAIETALTEGCKDPEGPFESARWRGDEVPAADRQGATFTLELQPRRQLEPDVRRRGP